MCSHKIPFFNMKKKNTLKDLICIYGIYPKGLKNEFERAVVKEPPMFEPLKFCCSYTMICPPAGGRSGGAIVLGKLPVPGRPTNLDKSRARAYCACSRCGWGLFGLFFLLSIISLFFLPLSGRRPVID